MNYIHPNSKSITQKNLFSGKIDRYYFRIKKLCRYVRELFCQILWLNCIGHKFFLGTFRTNDVVSVCNEAFANQRAFARWASKAVVVPVTAFKGYEPRASNTCSKKYTQNQHKIIMQKKHYKSKILNFSIFFSKIVCIYIRKQG